ncbi:hypothetical protein A3K69_08410 [Candidatus Bathyarchaeota archaeon RBG_16_57_9]|nr:MAG: hypothetical protein A3K69_08410 [Candidatus Bathyarchaeota archaeon RBG_16_57_9]
MSGFDWQRHWAEHGEIEDAAKFALSIAEKQGTFIKWVIRSLFRVVEDGGFLLFIYPDVYTHRMYNRDVKPDEDEMRR